MNSFTRAVDVENKTITVEYSGPWTVKLTYFKASGKYYGDGEYLSKKLVLWEIWDEVREMFKNHKRPGLVDGKNEFVTLVLVPEHPHDHPVLIMPSEEE